MTLANLQKLPGKSNWLGFRPLLSLDILGLSLLSKKHSSIGLWRE